MSVQRQAAQTGRRERQVAFWLLIFVIGGVFGFLYEEIFYCIDLGYLVKRGTTFGPWIPIYGFGALLICLTTGRLTRYPPAVLLTAGVVCGLLELATGYVLHQGFGVRLWDYNVEIWNWGNLGGYICARSVLFFGASGLLLQYGVVPPLRRLSAKAPQDRLLLAAAIPAGLFLGDILLSAVCRWLL